MKNFLPLALLFLFSFTSKPSIQLANIYYDEVDVTKYFVSEKLDGIRAYWNGKKLISRSGNEIKAPNWFIKNFPREEIEGELWIGRQKFEETISTVQKEIPQDSEWHNVKFMLFDAPKHRGKFSERLDFLCELVEKSQSPHLQIIEQKKIKNREALFKLLDETIKNGGEGLMLHKINSYYKAQRNDDLLKLKSYEDEEAKVIEHIAGKGKYEGQLGALLVENHNKIRFKIGSGFSDFERHNPPKIGSVITYKFYGKTKIGKPRFASFLREKIEL